MVGQWLEGKLSAVHFIGIPCQCSKESKWAWEQEEKALDHSVRPQTNVLLNFLVKGLLQIWRIHQVCITYSTRHAYNAKVARQLLELACLSFTCMAWKSYSSSTVWIWSFGPTLTATRGSFQSTITKWKMAPSKILMLSQKGQSTSLPDQL